MRSPIFTSALEEIVRRHTRSASKSTGQFGSRLPLRSLYICVAFCRLSLGSLALCPIRPCSEARDVVAEVCFLCLGLGGCGPRGCGEACRPATHDAVTRWWLVRSMTFNSKSSAVTLGGSCLHRATANTTTSAPWVIQNIQSDIATPKAGNCHSGKH